MTKRAHLLLIVGLVAFLPARPGLAQVTDPGLNPYVFTQNVGLGGAGSCSSACAVTSPPVPAGKRLVIERVSANGALTSPGILIRAFVVIQNGTNSLQASATDHRILASDGMSYAIDQPVLAYADAGSQVFVSIISGNASQSGATITVTGHLISCTPPTPAFGSANICAPIQPGSQ